MNILDWLIDGILRLDGDAVILHSGDKPYVIARSGDRADGWSQVELSSAPMRAEAIWRMLRDLLPADRLDALRSLGAADYEFDAPAAADRLALTAACSGDDDVWAEVRRTTRPAPAVAPEPPSSKRGTTLSIAHRAEPRAAEEPLPTPEPGTLDALLIAALAQGASMVSVAPNLPPLMRTGARMVPVGRVPPWEPDEIDRALTDVAARGVPFGDDEWAVDVAGVGRVHCVSFADAAGTGLLFELPSADVLSATEARLEPAIRALTECPDGLVLVAGPRRSGKSILLAVLVDLVNRSRPDHVITIQRRLRFAHASRASFVSQRVVHGEAAAYAEAVRAAVREGPDVLVIEGCEPPAVFLEAIAAARAGRLVLASAAAPASASAALARLVGGFPAEGQPAVRAQVAGCLRAVVSQVLLAQTGGGQVAAREVLLGTPAVAQLIARGADVRLPLAIAAGRRSGMRSLEDALVALVRAGVVPVTEARRAAPDQASLMRALQREGLERRA